MVLRLKRQDVRPLPMTARRAGGVMGFGLLCLCTARLWKSRLIYKGGGGLAVGSCWDLRAPITNASPLELVAIANAPALLPEAEATFFFSLWVSP